MPLIEVKMTAGRSKEQKVQFMKEVTELASRVLECPKSAVTVIIDDSYQLDEWSVGGETWEEIISKE